MLDQLHMLPWTMSKMPISKYNKLVTLDEFQNWINYAIEEMIIDNYSLKQETFIHAKD